MTAVFDRRKVRERYAGAASISAGASAGTPQADPGARVRVDAKKLGVDFGAQKELRAALVRAGYFGPHAVTIYNVIRAVMVISVPAVVFLFIQARLGHWSGLLKFSAVAGAVIISYYIGQGYLDRRRGALEAEYRLFFPDFLDMLVVCVDAGLSLEAALERVGSELGPGSHKAFRVNLQLMLAETRAGKSTIDALKAFSERLGLSEASSLTTLLQQSLELGTDVSASLSTFSEEMRDKRMSRAEQKAFALPVKITVPLALFILPTIFIAIMTPAVIKISTTLLD
ncbi:type II secretion system F family protein [Microvirga arabica]|uniref:type II secretion system F family protein n=1 Tax=Microvirga arabica TaxID=1128671 RepID=UPI00193936C7|nr:type II secretion system F family protein [Microvirga arabica]MBM1172017.1 type II secretion system F family protein [Microvirga arabica]